MSKFIHRALRFATKSIINYISKKMGEHHCRLYQCFSPSFQVDEDHAHNIWNMLEVVGRATSLNNGIVALPEGLLSEHGGFFVSYRELFKEAKAKSLLVRKILDFATQPPRTIEFGEGEKNPIVVLQFDSQIDNIIWFWAVVGAGGIPCLSRPFKADVQENHRYIMGLQKILESPIFITCDSQYNDFPNRILNGLRLSKASEVLAIKKLQIVEPSHVYYFPGCTKKEDDLAVIMLTSGSTGMPKAVGITHSQILTCLHGKVQKHTTTTHDVFMSWTDFTHVANLFEIHLQAVALNAMQVMARDIDIVTNPTGFLDVIDKFRISYTFSPNFALTALLNAITAQKLEEKEHVVEIVKPKVQKVSGFRALLSRLSFDRHPTVDQPIEGETGEKVSVELTSRWNLECLRCLISGGESNVVDTCVKLTKALQEYGAPESFIRPGFGMTETCAGCIYSLNSLTCTEEGNLEFASLGSPIIECAMRVVDEDGIPILNNRPGNLQLSGKAIFKGYYNNVEATEESFTKDGWFQTGDVALIDQSGSLHLVGRMKDTLLINGINHYPHAIERAIEMAGITGLKPSFTAVFPTRLPKSDSELMCVVFCPTYAADAVEEKNKTIQAIARKVVEFSGLRPYKIIPVPERLLEKSVLGKLSRPGLRAAFEEGKYDGYIKRSEQMSRSARYDKIKHPITRTEGVVLEVFKKIFSNTADDIGVDTVIFDLGISSIDLLKLRVDLQEELHVDLPVTLLFSCLTIQDLAKELEVKVSENAVWSYNPVVTLQPHGEKTPIFFIHPGMGEVLIFLNLSRLITDRPVYALRARGFDGEAYFKSMDEMITVYHAAIKRTQPNGPYALCGYSFGSILTFEITKRMLAEGDQVKFLGTLDQPPHFKKRAQTYDWYECVLSVSFFLGLIPAEWAYENMQKMRELTHGELLLLIIDMFSPKERIKETGMTVQRLDNWAKLALKMKHTAREYEPSGIVPQMDIFYTEPLIGIVAAKSTKEWRDSFIGKWDDFVVIPTYHFCGGGHRTIISPPHVASFYSQFKKRLEEREI